MSKKIRFQIETLQSPKNKQTNKDNNKIVGVNPYFYPQTNYQHYQKVYQNPQSYQNPQGYQNPQSYQNPQGYQNPQSYQNPQGYQSYPYSYLNTQSTQNTQSSKVYNPTQYYPYNYQNSQNSQNYQNYQNSQNLQNLQNYQNYQNSKVYNPSQYYKEYISTKISKEENRLLTVVFYHYLTQCTTCLRTADICRVGVKTNFDLRKSHFFLELRYEKQIKYPEVLFLLNKEECKKQVQRSFYSRKDKRKLEYDYLFGFIVPKFELPKNLKGSCKLTLYISYIKYISNNGIEYDSVFRNLFYK
jgi:hypothetical protein